MRVRRSTALRAAAIAGVAALAAAAALVGTAQALAGTTHAIATPSIHRYDHVVVVLHENKNYPDIASGTKAPYLQQLAGQGALFSQSFGATHPSQPNYIALFSGSMQGISDDNCPNTFTGKGNLFQQLGAAGISYGAYSEDLPSAGYTGCSTANYRRKHAPWVNFDNVDQSKHRPFSAFPTDYSTLPTVSFVIPNMCNDMHDCSISTGDTWQKNHLDAYAQWAKTHNSLLITSFDEDNFTSVNQIYTSFVGSNVTVGKYSEQIDHYRVLRTLEDMYGLPALGNAASRTAITDIFTG
jgi:acid phosphatase